MNMQARAGLVIIAAMAIAVSCQNIEVDTEILKPPVISNGRVDFRFTDTEGKSATISDPNGDAALYYTLDGSDPTTSSTLYTDTAISLDSDSVTVKAIAVKNGLRDSLIAEETFVRAWKQLPDMPNVVNPIDPPSTGPIRKKVLVAYDGYLYSVGGTFESSGNYPLDTCMRLNLDTGTSWETIDSLTTPRMDHACVVIGGKIYAIGGSDGTDLFATVEVLDLSQANPTWAAGDTLDDWVSGAAYAVHNGKVYLFGGYIGGYAYGMTTNIYTPGSSALAAGADIDMDGTAYTDAAGTTAVIGDRIFLFGGGHTSEIVGFVSAYSPPGSDSWDTSPVDMDPALRGIASEGFDGKGYLFGGISGDGTSPTRIYDPADTDGNPWSYDFDLPQPRRYISTTTDGERMYVAGGQGTTETTGPYLNEVWAFTP